MLCCEKSVLCCVFCSLLCQVLTLMSRAYHDAGDHMSARRCLLKGLHQFPTDMKLRFNLAFVLQVCVQAGAGWRQD